jgi:hypothetical protein
MRRAFLRVIGVGPADYRRRFRVTDPGPLPGASLNDDQGAARGRAC